MSETIETLSNKIDKIDQKLDDILKILSEKNNLQEETNQKINNHIEFIEKVYDKVSGPAFWVTNIIKNFELYSEPVDTISYNETKE